MFTGLVEATALVKSRQRLQGPNSEDQRLVFEVDAAFMQDVKLGDSISCNGVCLTALDLTPTSFAVDVSTETLRLTSLGGLELQSRVNLEKAMLPSTRMGGHMVSGHVDALIELLELQADARSWRYAFALPKSLARFVAVKGSVTLDGVSLTVNEVEADRFYVNLIPHTLEKTTLKGLRQGSSVNLEVDLIARYLDRLLSQRVA
jgi:riboflavin synthase